VLGAQFCRVHSGSLEVHISIMEKMILHTVPIALSADSQLVRNSVLLLLLGQLDIQVVTRGSESDST